MAMTPTFSHLFAGAPAWLIPLALIGVLIHVSAGIVGILAGTTAIAARKGERLHRTAGTVFFAAMMTMAGAAGILAASLVAIGVTAQIANIFASLFTFYLVGTAWMTVRRPEGQVGAFEVAGGLFAASIVGMALIVVAPLAGRHGSGVPAPAPYIFAAVAALGGALDVRVIRRGGLTGAARIARHLWRMCVGWFIATGSFFLGQQKDMPRAVQGSPVLIVLGVAPLALMLFWLGYVGLSRTFKSVPAPA